MPLDKAIKYGKENVRTKVMTCKPYTGAKAVDRTCRNHGSCDWCKANRLYSSRKREMASEDMLKEMNED